MQVGLVNVCEGIGLPVPLGIGTTRPEEIPVADQEKVVPDTFELNVTGADASPEQIVCVAGVIPRSGVGLMVMT